MLTHTHSQFTAVIAEWSKTSPSKHRLHMDIGDMAVYATSVLPSALPPVLSVSHHHHHHHHHHHPRHLLPSLGQATGQPCDSKAKGCVAWVEGGEQGPSWSEWPLLEASAVTGEYVRQCANQFNGGTTFGASIALAGGCHLCTVWWDRSERTAQARATAAVSLAAHHT